MISNWLGLLLIGCVEPTSLASKRHVKISSKDEESYVTTLVALKARQRIACIGRGPVRRLNDLSGLSEGSKR